jgi:Ycf66 protein N-terminus
VIGISAAALFGLVLIIASLSLFLTSKFKPDLYQESDNIYAVIGVVCGILLVASYDLNAAMAFQQLLMIGSLITIMWQFMQVRAENKRLKGGGRSAGREDSPRKGYSARIEDEPEYAPAKRRNRRSDDRFNNEREDIEELPSRRSATRQLPEDRFAETGQRRRFTEPTRTEVNSLARSQNQSWDNDEDWNTQEPVQVRRALPDADLASNQFDQSDRRPDRNRTERPDPAVLPRRKRDSEDNPQGLDPSPRRRPRTDRPSRQSNDADSNRQPYDDAGLKEGTTANYVDYEPINPPSGLPPSGSEPIVFPDRY